MIGMFGLDDLNGRILRTAILRSGHLDEKFMLNFELDARPEGLLPFHGVGATLVDVRPFVEVPGVGVTLLYRAPISSNRTRGELVAAFEGQVVPDIVADAAVADYSKSKPIPNALFWMLLEPLRQGIDSTSVDEVVASMSQLPKVKILAFARKFFDLLAELSTPDIASRHSELSGLPGDAFLWWRLALIASGEDRTRSVLSGATLTVDETDWVSAEEMADLCERAWEARTGSLATFSDGASPVQRLEGASARREYSGQRSFQAMIDDKRFPQIVGSRFLIEARDEISDCVAIQLIDIDSEDRQRVLVELAREVAGRVGGQLVSQVYGCNTYTGRLFDGLGVFRSKRPKDPSGEVIY